jgi:hypothetical protein
LHPPGAGALLVGRQDSRTQGAELIAVVGALLLLPTAWRRPVNRRVGHHQERAMAIRDLYVGMSGPDVRVVQKAFNTRRLPSEPALQEDGVFGPKTKAAIVGYQKRYGLKPDGIVGYRTRKQLFPNLAAAIRLWVERTPDLDAAQGPVPNSLRMRFGKTSFSQSADSSKAKEDGGAKPLAVGQSSPASLPSPSSGDIADFTLDGVTLPSVALPENLLGLKKDQAQLQGGAQFQTRHFFQNQGNSPNPSGAGVLTLQQVYARNKDQDGHLEVALGTQIVAPFVARTSDGMKWSVQPFVQFTWADIFWHRGDFHLVSPFAQLSAQTDFHFGSPVIGLGLFPINITYDVTNRVSIIGQAGSVGTFDTSDKRIEIGAQAALFGSVSF